MVCVIMMCHFLTPDKKHLNSSLPCLPHPSLATWRLMLLVSMNFIESSPVLSLCGASRFLRIPSSGIMVAMTVDSIKHLFGMKNTIFSLRQAAWVPGDIGDGRSLTRYVMLSNSDRILWCSSASDGRPESSAVPSFKSRSVFRMNW